MRGVAPNEESDVPYPIDGCEAVSTEQVDWSGQILVFPNPASDVLNIGSEIMIEKIKMSNLLGQEILWVNNPGFNSTINVGHLPGNIYLLHFISENKMWVQKVVVNR